MQPNRSTLLGPIQEHCPTLIQGLYGPTQLQGLYGPTLLQGLYGPTQLQGLYMVLLCNKAYITQLQGLYTRI